MSKEIPLHGKYGTGKFTIVDDEDYERVKNYSWSITANGYVVSDKNINGKRKNILIHRIIMVVNDSKICVDHINHDKLDNRKENLRICTKAENCRNKLSKKEFKGAVYDGKRKVWRVWCSHKYYGSYATQIEAAKAYDLAAIELHGEFALTNNLGDGIIPQKIINNYKSDHYGVSYYSNISNPWVARLFIGRKSVYLGGFKTEDEAGLAVTTYLKNGGICNRYMSGIE